MQTIRIQRLQVRHHLPAHATEDRRRLDRVLRSVLDTELERAVDQLGLDPREEVCIRRIRHTVKLRLSESDQALAEEWSHALASEILRSGDDSSPEAGRVEVVRYSSRVQALLDLAEGVARDDYERAWAWYQLGCWPSVAAQPSAAEAAAWLVRALGNDPAMTVPVLRYLAERSLLAPIIVRLEARQWIALALGSLQAMGAIVRPSNLAHPGDGSRPVESAGEAAGLVRLAERLARHSLLARATATTNIPASIRRAFAALVLVEAEPVFATSPRETLLGLLSALERSIASAESNATAASAMIHPKDLAEPGGQTRLAPAAVVAGGQFDMRCRALTTYGGLLFVISVVGRLGLPARMTRLFPERALRWALFHLALTLVPMGSDDPVALAFAGLAPDAQRPDEDETPPTDREREALVTLSGEISSELESLLAVPGRLDEHVMAWIYERRATLVAEPGWIEARFSLEDVSTDLRRAALDLDPGHVPWLGVVIKFIYE